MTDEERKMFRWRELDTEAMRRSCKVQLRKIGATEGEINFLLTCDLPSSEEEIDDWCWDNLDDLRRSQ